MLGCGQLAGHCGISPCPPARAGQRSSAATLGVRCSVPGAAYILRLRAAALSPEISQLRGSGFGGQEGQADKM